MIYKLQLCESPSKRVLRRAAKALSRLSVNFVVVDKVLLLESTFSAMGFCPVSERDFLLRHAAEMALVFAEIHSLKKNFFIQGGGFFTVTRIVLRLFEETDGVFLSSADFEAVAEAVADDCGAVLRKTPPPEVISLLISDDFSISCGDISVSFSDFLFSFSDFDISGIPPCCLPGIAEALEICGFLGDNEIKTELLSK